MSLEGKISFKVLTQYGSSESWAVPVSIEFQYYHFIIRILIKWYTNNNQRSKSIKRYEVIHLFRSKEPRKNPGMKRELVDPAVEELQFLQEQGLVRTGRLFGGLIDDIKRKAPW